MPKIVIEASRKYRVEQDVHRQFIDDCCVVEPGAWVSGSVLRSEYERWCKENGAAELGNRQFCERLREAGAETSVRRFGMERSTRGWSGIRLRLAVDGDARVDYGSIPF
jgi:putative DNA primase/helicase